MPFPIPITPRDLRLMRQQLRKPQEIICGDPITHIRYTLVAMDMVSCGKTVKAKITPPTPTSPKKGVM
jgi:hypothetical protein